MTGADSWAANSLSPEGFVNVFDGYYGNDTLTSGSGKDCINGGGDDDTIDGKGGDDLIIGGSGHDDLTGGGGADTFVYLSAGDGADVINDFSGNGSQGDTIDLTALNLDGGGKSVADLIADGFLIVDGNDILVDVDGSAVEKTAANGAPIDDNVLIAHLSVGAIFYAELDVLV